MPYRLGVIIPALNEESTIEEVVKTSMSAAQKYGEVRIIVSDNGSIDRTAENARSSGAEVVSVSKRGYGAACLEAIRVLGQWPDFLIFLDADGSSCPDEMTRLVDPLVKQEVDLVLGMRPDSTAMTIPQRWGTRMAVFLVNLRWGVDFQDMGPFRAIRREAFRRLKMRDRTWGWTIEMQILCVLRGLRYLEVPVTWRERQGGVSKISGTFSGVVRAGTRILWIMFRYSLKNPGFKR